MASCIERHGPADERKIHLRAGDGLLRLAAGCSSAQLEIELPFDGPSFSVAVLPNSLAAAVRACGRAPDLKVAGDELIVLGGGYHFTMPAVASELEATAPGVATVTLSSVALRRALRATLISVAPEDNRYGLGGLHFELGNGQLGIVATDGNRLSRRAIEAIGDGAYPRERLLRPKPAHLLLGLLAGADRSVTLSMSPDDLVVRVPADGVTLRTLLRCATFPDYRLIIPASWHASVLVDRIALLTSIRRLRPMCPTDALTIRATFSGDMLRLKAANVCGGRAWTQLPCFWPDGFVDPGVRGVGAEFLSQLVGQCPPGPVRWDVGARELDAMRISSPARSDHDYAILMPVRLD
jgi:DNA polymerase-3 subunit beta